MKNVKMIFMVLALFVSKEISANIYLPAEEKAALNERFQKISLAALKASGGADIVGNGGGAVEQAGIYIYRSLDRYITQCLNSKNCVTTEEGRAILKQIRDVILDNRDEKARVVFLTGNDFNKYMQDDLDPETRVAKTGFSPEFPIFINVEEAYTYPKESLYSSFVALFVHEIGHQVGVASHSYLDELAAHVRDVMEANTSELTYEVLNGAFTFTLFSSNGNYEFPQYILTHNKTKIEVPSLVENYKCSNGDKLVGASLDNPHWEKGRTENYKFILGLSAWGSFYCERKKNKTIYFEQKNVQITWNFTVEMLPGDYFIFLLNDTKMTLK